MWNTGIMEKSHKPNSNTTKIRRDCKPFIVFVVDFLNKSKKKTQITAKI